MKTEKQNSQETASLTVTRLPAGDIAARVLAIANAAKSAAWHSGYDGMPLPDDSKFIRGALALVHMLEASGVMCEAAPIVFLLVAEFEDDDSPAAAQSPRAALLATPLDDPSRFMVEAVQTNRRVLGMPPQIELVPDDDGEVTQ